MGETDLVNRVGEINGFLVIDNSSWPFDDFFKVVRIADILSPNGEINRLYFLGLEKCYATRELPPEQVDRGLHNRLIEKGYIFYENLVSKNM